LATSTALLLVTVIIASAVECIEALTIILAVGISRGWRSALEGTALSIVLLVAIVAILGPALINYVPINILRLVVGILLLIFGLQWLYKAILRGSGYKALRDEATVFQSEVATLSNSKYGRSGRRDSVAFVVSFKGMFLEGMEIIIIVISFGVPTGQLTLCAIGAVSTALIVGGIGAMLARPIARMPENLMKLGVGMLLSTFGTFWMGEGAGIEWPTGDVFLLILLIVFGILSFTLIRYLKRTKRQVAREA
jgi:uncharacterized membrane protein